MLERVRDAQEDRRGLAVAPKDDGQIVVGSVPAQAHEEEHRGDGVMDCIPGGGHGRRVTNEIAEHARGEQRRSVDDAEGHEQDAKQPGGHVLHNDLVFTKGTKEDLVEGGRRGDGSVHVDPVLRFQCNRVYEERGGFTGANYTTYARREAPPPPSGAHS